jgi:exonuclease III
MSHFNAQSVGPAIKRTAINDFVLDNDIDMLLLTETWLRSSGDEAKCTDLTPTGYKLHSVPRPPRTTGQFARGGGVAFLFKDSFTPLSTVKIDFPFQHSTFELAQLSLNLQHIFVNFICVYRPPPSKKNMLKDTTFFDELPSLLEYCSSLYGKVIIAGDFNIHYEDDTDTNTVKFRDLVCMFDLVQSVNEPTHVHGHILDLVLYPCSDNLVSSTNVCHDLTSDHVSVLCKLSVPKPVSRRTVKHIRSVHKIDKSQFKSDLDTVITADMSLPDLNSSLKNLLDQHAPLHQLTVRAERATPWYNTVAPQLTELKRERRKAESRWRSSGLTVHKQIYNYIKRNIADLVQNAKTNFFSTKISASKTCKELYRNMNQILGKTKAAVYPSNIEPSKLPDLFLNFFRDKIVTIRNAFALPCPSGFTSTYSGPTLSKFEPVTSQFVKKILQKTAKKSCELDPIPTSILHENIDTLLPAITNIFNSSLSSGSVPDDFKTAIVKPLLKKSSLDPNELNNFRPISNLPFLSKILEKVVLHQLSQHLLTNNLLSLHQSAYRAGHSTETALIRILNDILTSLDDDKISVLLLLDLSAAFDTIDHEILLTRLRINFGICDTALNWFRSYLSNRKQFVLIDENQSSKMSLDFGVPQGSVLGPVLFIMYTTPLTKLINNHSVHHEMYADDTQLEHSDTLDNYNVLVKKLQDCVSDIKTWMSTNKLKLNDDKTEAIRFIKHKQTQNLHLYPSIELGSTEISFMPCVRDLGLYLDSDLTLKHHTAKICQASFLELRRISSIRPFLTEQATKTLVSSCILSRLDYCNALLLGVPAALLQPLQRVQNSAARLIYKAPKRHHTSDLLKQLHWLKIEYRIQYKSACLCHKIIGREAPAYLSELFEIYVPARSLRSSSDGRIFRIPSYNRKQHGSRAFSHSAATLWNSLPFSLRHAPSFLIFKSALKTHLFKKQLLNTS